jgi:hypothetical protein
MTYSNKQASLFQRSCNVQSCLTFNGEAWMALSWLLPNPQVTEAEGFIVQWPVL